MRNPTIIDRAANALKYYRENIIRRRNAQKVEGLPAYLLKDIGWPASTSDCCTDRLR
jgi:hypothetical protein